MRRHARAIAEIVPIDIDAIAALPLSQVERTRARSFRADRRVAEFVAGRLAAREAIAAIVGPLPDDFAIDRHDDGAPKLVGLDEVLSLSISHGKNRAYAIAAEGSAPLGVDLTDDRDAPRIRRVQRRAFPHPREVELVLATDDTACRAWALKEAVAKTLRMGLLEQSGFERIEIVSIDPPRVEVDGVSRDHDLELVIARDGESILAICLSISPDA